MTAHNTALIRTCLAFLSAVLVCKCRADLQKIGSACCLQEAVVLRLSIWPHRPLRHLPRQRQLERTEGRHGMPRRPKYVMHMHALPTAFVTCCSCSACTACSKQQLCSSAVVQLGGYAAMRPITACSLCRHEPPHTQPTMRPIQTASVLASPKIHSSSRAKCPDFKAGGACMH
jgi:hypothetical protein